MFQPLASCAIFDISNPSREKKVINENIADSVQLLLLRLGSARSFMECHIFDDDKPQPTHNTVLDKAIKVDLGATCSWADTLVQKLKDTWSADLQELAGAMADWMPRGWQLHKNHFVERVEAMREMAQNPNYQRLSQASGLLSTMLENLKKISETPFVDAPLIKEATTTLQSAKETVAVTYSIYQIGMVIPAQTHPVLRKREAKALLEALKNKHCKKKDEHAVKALIGSSLAARLDQLIQGGSHTPIDFTKKPTPATPAS